MQRPLLISDWLLSRKSEWLLGLSLAGKLELIHHKPHNSRLEWSFFARAGCILDDFPAKSFFFWALLFEVASSISFRVYVPGLFASFAVVFPSQ